MEYRVYLLECADGTLYCGMTSLPVEERLRVHNEGKGAKYMRGGRLPAVLAATAGPYDKREALAVERRVKSRPRRDKRRELASSSPGGPSCPG